MMGRVPAVLCVAVLLLSSLVATTRAQDDDVPGRIAFVRDGGIRVWENGETTELGDEETASDPRWSPDGESILFVESGNSFSDLAVLNVQTEVPLFLTDNQSASEVGSPEYRDESVWVSEPSWAASGTIAYVSDYPGAGALFGIWLMDGADGAAYAAPFTIGENVDSVSLSGDATVCAFALRESRGDGTFDSTVYLGDLATGEVFLAAQSGGEVFDPAMSPDGARMAVAIREEGGRTDVWIVDRATLDRRRVTRDAEALAPTWSPDGRWLAFLKLEDFEFEVWVAAVEDGEAGEPFRLFSEDDIDSRSGLSWWLPPEPEESADA